MSRLHSAAVAVAALLAMPTMAHAQSKDTRFGPVSIERNVLMFRGRPVVPSVESDVNLLLDEVVQVGSYDAVVVANSQGGNGCPVMWQVVTVTAQGARSTPPFGTCSEGADVSRKGDGVSLRMHAYSTLARDRAGLGGDRRDNVFIVRNGVVTDNGKPVH